MAFNKRKARNWCFTINNPQEKWKNELISMTEHKDFRYVICQLERGDEGTRHIQGYIQFNGQLRGSTIKKIHAKAHWEIAAGSLEQNEIYCSKDETSLNERFQLGEPKAAGRRTDIETAVKDLTNGKDIVDVVNETPHLVRYRRQLLEHQQAVLRKGDRHGPFIVEAHWGAAESGKTKFIMDKGDVFQPARGLNGWWWDGYAGEKRILFDDFYGTMRYTDFLRMTDPEQQFKADVKGVSPVKIQANEYYFTSNNPPNSWYLGCDKFDSEAFNRRFTTVIKYEREGNWKSKIPKQIVRRVNPDYEMTDVIIDTMPKQSKPLMLGGVLFAPTGH